VYYFLLFFNKESHYEELREFILIVYKTEVFSGVSYFGRGKLPKSHLCFIRIWAGETHRCFTAFS